jgi:hypothetical protein
MPFSAELLPSESGVHYVLMYRSTRNQELAFKFCHKRTNQDTLAYICMGCKQAAKGDKTVSVNSIYVSMDYSHFNSDPERMNHFCLERNVTFRYNSLLAIRVYRLVFEFAVLRIDLQTNWRRS